LAKKQLWVKCKHQVFESFFDALANSKLLAILFEWQTEFAIPYQSPFENQSLILFKNGDSN